MTVFMKVYFINLKIPNIVLSIKLNRSCISALTFSRTKSKYSNRKQESCMSRGRQRRQMMGLLLLNLHLPWVVISLITPLSHIKEEEQIKSTSVAEKYSSLHTQN
ncbi:UNKNOWN [Stylonychia lemnae]|uniref:Uncharacterized protein n=1 Tax=Stylonychia lemnae TaxID=5949 RepID=A0A078AAW9_STYLE|nr:UNKNOWN [Stylonychia lemnae]|eukprot:CDW79001.1 UNKNOWN [Stylonychia lemnae]